MAERVRSQYTNLVKMRLDQASIKRTRKQIRNFRSEASKLLKLKVETDKSLGHTERNTNSNKSYKGRNEEHFVRKELDKTYKMREKREVDLLKLRKSHEGKLAKESLNSRSEAVKNLTSKSGAGKAKDTLLAQQLANQEKDSLNKSLMQTKLEKESLNSRRDALRNLTSKSGTGKAKDTLLAQQLAKQEKDSLNKSLMQNKLEKESLNNRRDALRNLTRSSGAEKAKDTLLGQQLAKQDKLNTLQIDQFNNLKVSNRLTRELSNQEKEVLKKRLMQTKSAKELRLEVRKIKGELSDKLAMQKRSTKEAKKQLAVQRRFESSVTQMVGAFGSIYAGISVVRSSILTGAKMEGVEKSFKVVSEDSAAAKDNMKWVRIEAQRLGTPIMEASRGFASMIAASGDKMSLDDIKSTFTGIQEAGVALGLGREDLNGTILAVKQMLSKGKIQAKFIGLSKLH